MATKLENARKVLGKQDLEELDKMDGEELKKRIVQANEAMREAHDELESNDAYQKAKADASALSAGKRDVNKRQNAVVAYCLHRLSESGSTELSVEVEFQPGTTLRDLSEGLARAKSMKVGA